MVCIIVSLYCQNVISLFFQKRFPHSSRKYLLFPSCYVFYLQKPHTNDPPLREKIFHEDLRRKYLEDTQQIFHFAWSNVAGAPSNVMCT